MRDNAVLVETTVLVDYLRGSDTAAEYLDKARAEGDLLCSAVTHAELIVGSRTRWLLSSGPCGSGEALCNNGNRRRGRRYSVEPRDAASHPTDGGQRRWNCRGAPRRVKLRG